MPGDVAYPLEYPGFHHMRSVTTDGTYGDDKGIIDSAKEGETVTVYFQKDWEPNFTNQDTSEAIVCTLVTTYVWAFTMPAAAVNMNEYYND